MLGAKFSCYHKKDETMNQIIHEMHNYIQLLTSSPREVIYAVVYLKWYQVILS